MPQFSSQLIARLQHHFRSRFGVQLTAEQANEYLHSLADLFLSFVDLPDSAGLPDRLNAGGQDGSRTEENILGNTRLLT